MSVEIDTVYGIRGGYSRNYGHGDGYLHGGGYGYGHGYGYGSSSGSSNNYGFLIEVDAPHDDTLTLLELLAYAE